MSRLRPRDLGSSLAFAASWLCGHGKLDPVPEPHFPMSSGTSSKNLKGCYKATGGLCVKECFGGHRQRRESYYYYSL